MGKWCNYSNKCLSATGPVSLPEDICVILEGINRMYFSRLGTGKKNSQTTLIILQESAENVCFPWPSS